jgi:hypothetical protein
MSLETREITMAFPGKAKNKWIVNDIRGFFRN